ncbi:flagellar FlbD family protein [Flavisphingomonas formosensis]|uniref:flagellar FlbD family protein n=1 Tax=Flavisphingomonas formosensis TaxID=861534 RepID=UPI0012F842F7|nr:flagellar FlbD family protein [Sphingomonas formosensis]
MIELKALSGEVVAVDPDMIESVRPNRGTVVVRMINGSRRLVRGPYLNVLEQLATR